MLYKDMQKEIKGRFFYIFLTFTCVDTLEDTVNKVFTAFHFSKNLYSLEFYDKKYQQKY